MKKKKMITIIAILLVTILITAYITVALTLENIKNSELSSNGYKASPENTNSNLIASYIKKGVKIGGIIGTFDALDTSDATATPEDIAFGKTAYVKGQKITGTREETVIIEDVIIPKGFYYAGGSKDTGIVISDSRDDKKEYTEENKNADVSTDLKGNQFVWVPVPDPTKLFANETAKLNGVTTTTDVYSKLTIRDGDKSSYTAGIPGETSKVREPDVLSSYDTKSEYADIILGTSGTGNAEELAKVFVNDYKAMSDSIKKYKGFYIGRYELTGTVDAPTEKKGASLTKQNWYQLYKACKGFTKGNVISTMIYGCQWDATMEWLKQTKFRDDPSKVDKNSSSWGNYGSGSKIDTGSNLDYQANKIFDLAGNCSEWTQEARSTNSRVIRRWFLRLFRFWLSSFRP